MIVPDINLLVYAYNADAPRHAPARQWWEQAVRNRLPVGLPWAVACGFVRIMTDRRILERPFAPGDAVDCVRLWLAQPSVHPIEPGPRHLDILQDLLAECGVGGPLTTDAHLAALAIECHAELHSNDTDFGRFAALKWVNPLS